MGASRKQEPLMIDDSWRTFGFDGGEKIKPWIAYAYFVGWWSWSLGFTIDVKSPNIEIHLPTFFIRMGRRSW